MSNRVTFGVVTTIFHLAILFGPSTSNAAGLGALIANCKSALTMGSRSSADSRYIRELSHNDPGTDLVIETVTAQSINAHPLAQDLQKLGFDNLGDGFWQQGRLLVKVRENKPPLFFVEDQRSVKSKILKMAMDEHKLYFEIEPDRGWLVYFDQALRGGLGNYLHSEAKRIWMKKSISPLTPVESVRKAGLEPAGSAENFLFVRMDAARNQFEDSSVAVILRADRLRVFEARDNRQMSPLFRSPDISLVKASTHAFENSFMGDVVESDVELLLLNTREQVGFIWKGSGWIENPVARFDLETIPPALLEIPTPVIPQSEVTGFVRGGVNASSTILSANSFNGLSLAQLNQNMAPNPRDSADSSFGYLLPGQDLRSVMAEQNEFVVGKMHSTHQIVAGHLKYFMRANRLGFKLVGYHGRKYQVRRLNDFDLFSQSPFGDHSRGGSGFVIERLDAHGQVVANVLVANMTINMIESWGFYGGPGVQTSMDLGALFETLDFLKPPAELSGQSHGRPLLHR